MPRISPYWAGALAALLAWGLLLSASPYRSNLYESLTARIYVDSYQDDAFWPDVAHEVSGLSEQIRSADVLLLGSSKTLFGLSAAGLEARFGSRVRFFNLGIGGGEGVLGANTLIERLDLRGHTLVVNLDNDMLSDKALPRSRQALAMDRFQAATRVYSVRLRAVGDTWLDRLGLPQLSVGRDGLHVAARERPRTYRDARTGDALAAKRSPPPAGTQPLLPAPPRQALAAEALARPHFRAIVEGWRSRGFRLVFIVIPYANGEEQSDYNPALPEEAARRYGGRAVALDWRLARTSDGIHVDRASRERLTQELAGAIAALPALFEH